MERPGAEQSLVEAVGLLVTAWRNLAVYPVGHPAASASILAAHGRLAEFMAASGRLVLGVARDALLYGERKLESINVQAFAEALYRRNAALVYIEEDVQVVDLEIFLGLLAESTDGDRLPIGEALLRRGIDRIAVSSIDYTQLVTTDHLTVREPRPVGSLWDTLIQALLTGKQLTLAGSVPLPGETYSAAGIAALLRGFSLPGPAPGGSAEEEAEIPGAAAPLGGLPAWRVGPSAIAVVVGAVSEHLGRVKGRDRDVAVHQVAELLRALPAEVREPLLTSALKSLDAEGQTAEHLQRLTGSLAPDQVLQSLRRLNSEGVRLSPHALRMIQTLARARQDLAAPPPSTSVAADIAEVSALFLDEDVDRFNPDDHRALLAQVAEVDLMAVASRPPAGAIPEISDESLGEEATEAALVATVFDLAAAYPDSALPLVIGRLRTLLLRSLDGAHFERALTIVRGLRALAEDDTLTPAQRMGRAPFVASLVESLSLSSLLASTGSPDNLTLSQIQELVTALGPAAARSLLGALTVETDRTRRFQLFDLAVSLGSAVVPEATRLLSDPRWFVVRNMIVLLRQVGDRTSLGEIQRCAGDPDPRVALEAIMTLLASESEVSRDLLAKLIHNPDPKLAEAAVALTGQHGIVEAIDPLVAVLLRWDPLGRRLSLRLKALRALRTLNSLEHGRDPSVLTRLERYYRPWRVPLVQLEERRAAFRLLDAYPAHERALYVERGRRSRDAVIRNICDRLARASAPPAEGA